MFQGDFKYVKVEFDGQCQWIRTSDLTAKEAADPNIMAGVFVTLSNGLDRLVVVGDDVYKLTTHARPDNHAWWVAKKLPKEAGDEVIAMLNLRER